MQLWNDYEGRTIAEAYPLNKLVRPEGRSAFFLTTNGTGTPAMVRLIEAHFDESEILNRWRAVSEIKQENLVAMRKFGETELDGTPLVYAVMEPTEISLAELLENRTLTAEEARQLANSLLAALQALHERGLVHEHVEAVNILAAGEVIKLRSDCVREAVLDPEGEGPSVAEQKARDAHALAVVLLQALTGRSSLQGSATLLPTPFDGIIRNGLSGKWGLAEMAAALGPVTPKQAAAATARPLPAAVPRQESKPASAPVAKLEPQPVPETKTAVNQGVQAAKVDAASVAKALASTPAPKPLVPVQAPDVRHRIVKPVEDDPRRTRLWIAGAVGVLLLLILFWRLMRNEPATGANAASQPISTLASPQSGEPASTAPASVPQAKPTAAGGAGVAPTVTVTANRAAAGGRTQWRVVAYTFNRENQAQQKADSLAKRNPSLSPEVFSPSGHAPYLVTVGGAMTHDQAEAFKQKARNSGLPHDTYTQNYAR